MNHRKIKRRYPENRRRQQPKRDHKKSWRSLLTLIFLTAFGFMLWKAAEWTFKSDYFAVSDMSVSGLRYVKEKEIKDTLKGTLGSNIFRVSASEYEAKLEEIPWIQKARIYRSLPSKLEISITERNLLALYNTGEDLIAIDDAGNRIAPPRVGEVYDLPLLNVSINKDVHLLEAINFLRAAKTFSPEVYSQISELTADSRGNLIALMTESAKSVKVGRGDYRNKVLKLWLLLRHPDIKLEQYLSLDIRFDNKIFYINS